MLIIALGSAVWNVLAQVLPIPIWIVFTALQCHIQMHLNACANLEFRGCHITFPICLILQAFLGVIEVMVKTGKNIEAEV